MLLVGLLLQQQPFPSLLHARDAVVAAAVVAAVVVAAAAATSVPCQHTAGDAHPSNDSCRDPKCLSVFMREGLVRPHNCCWQALYNSCHGPLRAAGRGGTAGPPKWAPVASVRDEKPTSTEEKATG